LGCIAYIKGNEEQDAVCAEGGRQGYLCLGQVVGRDRGEMRGRRACPHTGRQKQGGKKQNEKRDSGFAQSCPFEVTAEDENRSYFS
jgi:hypothetical protein